MHFLHYENPYSGLARYVNCAAANSRRWRGNVWCLFRNTLALNRTCWGATFWFILSTFWPFWCHKGPISALNSKLSQTSHVTTQNDCKRGRIPMEILLEVTFKRFRSFRAISMCIRILLLWRLFWLVTWLVYGNCEFGAQNGTVHSCTLVSNSKAILFKY